MKKFALAGTLLFLLLASHMPTQATEPDADLPQPVEAAEPSPVPDPAAPAPAELPSPWAADMVRTAIFRGIVPQALQARYTEPITRAEFSALAVALYETITGEEIAERMTFNDSTDINVQKIGGIGVVLGVGSGNFNPHGTLTREQAAVMLYRLWRSLDERHIPLPPVPPFTDMSDAADWATGPIMRMWQTGLMSGVREDMFAPKGTYTIEQSIITMLRLYDMMREVLIVRMTVWLL